MAIRESRNFSAVYKAFLLIAFVVFACGVSRAEEAGRPLSPPRSLSGETYLDAVQGHGLQAKITYLSENPSEEEVEDPSYDFDGWFDIGETTGWVLLALVAIAVGVVAYRSRYAMGELRGPSKNSPFPQTFKPASPDSREIDHSLVERLRAEPDPREGLRIVLQRFLALAAEENSVAVKRSLTTREIMRRLPGGFSHRRELEILASEVEQVVFGGQAIDAARYQYCLDLASPFLRRTQA